MWCHVIFLAAAIASAGATPTSLPVDAPGDVYVGLRQELLLERLGYTALRTELGERGVDYRLESKGGSLGVRSITLSVSPTVSDASGLFEEICQFPAVRPALVDEQFGDEYRVWVHPSGKSGSVALRRANVVFHFSWQGDLDDALGLVRQIDRILVQDRLIAPLGRFVQAPRVAGIGISPTLEAGRRSSIHAEILGLGALQELRLGVYDDHHSPLILSAGEAGKRYLHVPEGSSLHKMTVVAANPLNVFVRKTTAVTIAGPGPTTQGE